MAYFPPNVSYISVYSGYLRDNFKIHICDSFFFIPNHRLGLGEIGKENEYEHRPNRIPTFSMLRLKIFSVSCGQHHNLALTERGVSIA